jgi:hypothetical protein
MLRWLDELTPVARRNLGLELVYSVGTGVIAGLVLVAQVVAVGSLQDTSTAVTVMVAAQPAVAVLLPVWAGVARWRRLQEMAVIGGSLRCLPLLAVAWVDQPWQLAAVVLGYYLLGGPASLAVSSLYKYTYPDAHRGKIMGLLRLVQHGVTVPVLLGVSWWSDQVPDAYRLAYPIGGFVGLLGVFAYRLLDIPTDDPRGRRKLSERPTWAGVRQVLLLDQKFSLFQATIFLTGVGFLMTRAVWLYLLHEQFHLPQFTITMLVLVLPVILGGLTSPLWGALIDRTSPVAGRIAFALLGIPAYLAFFGSFFLDWLVLAYVGAVLRGVVLGAAEVATTTGNLYFAERPERAALYESISALFQGFRGLTMPALGWAVYQGVAAVAWPVGVVFLMPTVFNAWSFVVAVRLWKEDRRRHAVETEVAPKEVDELESE